MPAKLLNPKLLASAGAALLGVIGFGVVFGTLWSTPFSEDQQLKLAARWLDEGRWDVAGRVAKELEPSIDPEVNSAWHYVQGVARLLPILDDLDSYENRAVLGSVTEQLQKSRQLGYPVSQRGKGNYYLGVCLYNTYRWDEAIEALDYSLADYPQRRSESLRMMFSAHLRKPKPDAEAAQAILNRWTRMPGLSKRELAQTKLAAAQLAIHERQFVEAEQWLSQIKPGIPEHFEALKWQAMNLLGHGANPASIDAVQLEQAQSILQKLIVASETPQGVRRQAIYLVGKVLRALGKLDEAIGTLSSVRQQNPFSAEAIAASLEEAEILLELGQFNDVVTTTQQLLSGINDIQLYNETWIPASEMVSRLMGIANHLQDNGLFELALEVANQLHPAFPAGQALRLQATILANWSYAVETTSSRNDAQARSTLASLHVRAAQKYEQLAAVDLRAKDYLEIVWHAIDNYQKAGHMDAANRLIKTTLQYESRTKRPRALLAMARNHIAQGDWQASLEPLQRCFDEHPASPGGYEARLVAAQAHKELNNLDEALELLSVNLWDGDLHPDNSVWKDSFLELGHLLVQRGERQLSQWNRRSDLPWEEIRPILQRSHSEFVRAGEMLNEAVQRFPSDPQIDRTRYQLARSFQSAAQFPEQSARHDPTLNESNRGQLLEQRKRLLEDAATHYRELHQTIEEKRDRNGPGALEDTLLRQAYFGEADVLMQLGRYDDAIATYRMAATTYAQQPEALEAWVQIAQCHRNMGREEDAQKAIHQAELALERIPAEQDSTFVSVTRGDRAHWHRLLGRLKPWN